MKITEDTRISFERKPNKFLLIIQSAQESDAGIYTFKASNDVGSESAQTNVTVEVPPVVVETLKNLEILENTPVEFICEFYGQPEPQIKWYAFVYF